MKEQKIQKREKNPMHRDLRNLIKVNSFYNFLAGIIGPFLVIFFNKFGSIEEVGISFALLLIFEGLISFFASGKLRAWGIKKVLFITQVLESLRIMGFLFVTNVYQVYLLQIIGGIFKGFNVPAYNNLYVDVCEDESSRSIGYMSGIVTVFYGVSVLMGGLIIGAFGYKPAFILWAVQEFVYGVYVYANIHIWR